MTETKKAYNKRKAVDNRKKRQLQSAAWKRLGMGAAEFAAIINGMDKDELALLRAMLEGAKANGEVKQ